jgi:hypothetical protein
MKTFLSIVLFIAMMPYVLAAVGVVYSFLAVVVTTVAVGLLAALLLVLVVHVIAK